MPDLVALRAANERRWAVAKLTRGPEFERPATNAFANKVSYLEIEKRTGVHWCFVAVTPHYRECRRTSGRAMAQGTRGTRFRRMSGGAGAVQVVRGRGGGRTG